MSYFESDYAKDRQARGLGGTRSIKIVDGRMSFSLIKMLLSVTSSTIPKAIAGQKYLKLSIQITAPMANALPNNCFELPNPFGVLLQEAIQTQAKS